MKIFQSVEPEEAEVKGELLLKELEEIINHNRKDLINFINGLNQSLLIIDKYKEGEEE